MRIEIMLTCFWLGGSFTALKAESGQPEPARVANKFSLPGDERWDFLTSDDATGRLFISHGNQVQVMDESSGKLLGNIPDTKGVHGIALAEELNLGFISNGKDSSVTFFNLKTLATLFKAPVTGQNPDAILYDAFSHQVFAFNGKSANATVLDAATGHLKGTIPLSGKPEVPVTDGKGTLYVNIEDKNSVDVIDVKSLKVRENWPIAPGQSASGMAIDLNAGRLLMVCENKLLIVLDLKSHGVVTSVPIGEHVDGVAFDAATGRVFSSNGEGTITVAAAGSDGKFKVLETLPTQKGARTIALNSKTHHLFLSTAEFEPTPAPTAAMPKPRPAVKPNTFVILDINPGR